MNFLLRNFYFSWLLLVFTFCSRNYIPEDTPSPPSWKRLSSRNKGQLSYLLYKPESVQNLLVYVGSKKNGVDEIQNEIEKIAKTGYAVFTSNREIPFDFFFRKKFSLSKEKEEEKIPMVWKLDALTRFLRYANGITAYKNRILLLYKSQLNSSQAILRETSSFSRWIILDCKNSRSERKSIQKILKSRGDHGRNIAWTCFPNVLKKKKRTKKEVQTPVLPEKFYNLLLLEQRDITWENAKTTYQGGCYFNDTPSLRIQMDRMETSGKGEQLVCPYFLRMKGDTEVKALWRGYKQDEQKCVYKLTDKNKKIRCFLQKK